MNQKQLIDDLAEFVSRVAKTSHSAKDAELEAMASIAEWIAVCLPSGEPPGDADLRQAIRDEVMNIFSEMRELGAM